MKVINRNSNFVNVEFSAEEYRAFIEILKLKETHLKDYGGGK